MTPDRSRPLDDVSRWLVWLLALHALTWIILPSLLEGSIRLDVSEGAIGGREWQLAYLRHPPFTTWLMEVARWTGPLRYTAVYAIGQALAIGGLVLIALTAAQLEPSKAEQRPVFLLTIMLGLTSPVLTYIPIQVSHNIGLMLATGLVILTAWRAFERGTIASWAAFGVAVGLSLWVKYAIGLLILPLIIAFLVVPAWRRQVMRPGPWLSVLLAGVIITPHAIAVIKGGATTISFATRTVSAGLAVNCLYAFEFLLNAALFMLPMMLIVVLMSGGVRPVWARIRSSVVQPSRADIFRHAVAFGPVLVTALAALTAGVKPRLLWLTPMVLPLALWCAHYATPLVVWKRGLHAVAGLTAALIVSYAATRLISPYVNAKPFYPDYDGPALAAFARDHWVKNEAGPLRYIVSFGQQRGRQAAGSVAFDLPSTSEAPIHVMEDGSLAASPWIDVADLRKNGALVISPVPLETDATVQGLPVLHIVSLPRPIVRGASKPAARIWFGIVEPGN